MKGIEKIAAGGVQFVSSAIQKTDGSVKFASQTIIPEKLEGLNALAAQKMPFIQNGAKAISQEEQNLIALTKKELNHLFEEFPSDDTIGFIVRNFIDSKSPRRSEIRQLALAIGKFREMPSGQADKLLNSEFVSMLINSPNATRGFKFDCLNLSADKIDLLEPLTKNPLTKVFSESFFSKRSGNGEDINKLTEEFQRAIEPICDFSKLSRSSSFYDLLCARNSDDISELVQILQKRITAANDKQINELHSLLKTLLEAKTPDDKFIFGSSKVGDKTSKTMMSGIENIINSKFDNPKQFDILMDLLSLTQKGKIPPCALGTLAEKGKINPEFIAEAQKIGQGIDFIVQHSTKAAAIENSKVGEVVQVGAELFYRNQDGLSKINLNPDKFRELFPKAETMALSQGKLGDCYLVSAIHDFMRNDKGREKIFEMFSFDGNDIIVTIPDAKEFPIRFVNGVIQKDGDKNINAPKGIQMLEDAYRQTRALKYGTSSKMTSIEGGEQMSVYNAFLGKANAKSYMVDFENLQMPSGAEIENDITENGKKIKELQAQVKNLKDSDNYWDHLYYLQEQETIRQIGELQAFQRCFSESLGQLDNYNILEKGKLSEKLLEFSDNPDCIISAGTVQQGNWLDKTKLIHGQHAYSIKSVDNAAKTVDVVNPWNTAQYVTLSFDEFEKYFSTINVAQIN